MSCTESKERGATRRPWTDSSAYGISAGSTPMAMRASGTGGSTASAAWRKAIPLLPPAKRRQELPEPAAYQSPLPFDYPAD